MASGGHSCALCVVSHDEHFLRNIGITQTRRELGTYIREGAACCLRLLAGCRHFAD
jgi:ABC-type uncharacterized transport system ATPase subunit